MSKKYNVMIVADMPERIKQVKENILRGLIEADVIQNVFPMEGTLGVKEFAEAEIKTDEIKSDLQKDNIPFHPKK